jgi:hypothetical protein
VPIERPRIATNIVGQVAGRRDTRAFIAAVCGPSIECIPDGGVERLRVRRSHRRARKGALPREHFGAPQIVDQHRGSADGDDFDIERPAALADQRDAVLTGIIDAHRARWRVDAVRHAVASGRACDGQAHASFNQPDQVVGKEVDRREVIDVEHAAVAIDHFGATVASAKLVAGHKRQVERRVFDAAVADDGRAPLEIGHVGGSRRVSLFGGLRETRHRKGAQTDGEQHPRCRSETTGH